MTTLHLRKSIGSSPWRRAFLLIPLLFGCFALSQSARAVSPAPDGGYTGANTAEGTSALFSLTTGSNNTALGSQTLFSLTTGIQNTAVGAQALKNNKGDKNTAIGLQALFFNAGANNNAATGWRALYHNTTGTFNDAVGANALVSNVDGFSNNALGESALFRNIHASGNTAIGDVALANNDSTGKSLGNSNTAVGAGALFSNTNGNSNNAVGFNALGSNTDGLFNNAVGFEAMGDNVHGVGNVAVGDSTGAGVEGDFNIYIGAFAGPAPSPAPVAESETIRIGDTFNTACFIGGINGVNQGSGTAVFINTTTGQLGTQAPASSRRFKKEIKPMNQTSEAILGLKPVTFHYKSDSKDTPQFGLIAEEVAQVNPDLIMRDEKGEIYTVRYDAVNAMLLNEFLKEHRKVEEQQATITELKSTVTQQEAIIAQQQKGMKAVAARLDEQASQIQKVSAQLEMRKPAPRTVLNNQ